MKKKSLGENSMFYLDTVYPKKDLKDNFNSIIPILIGILLLIPTITMKLNRFLETYTPFVLLCVLLCDPLWLNEFIFTTKGH